MKKIIGLLLAVAFIFTLVSVLPAAAFVNVLNIDYINVLTAEGDLVAQVVGGSAAVDIATAVDAGYIGDVKPLVNAGGVFFDIMGWYMPEKEMADIGLSFDGGEPTYGYALYDQNLIDVLVTYGYGDTAPLALRISAMLPIQEGTHEIAFVVKFADNTTRTIYKFRYRNLYDTVYENVALNKPVYAEVYAPPSEICAISDNVFWQNQFINDGQAPVFDGVNVVPLGWYVYTNGPDVDARSYIDLQGVYDVKEVKMTSMGFNVYSYPNTYKVLASLDGVNWTEIGGESGAGAIAAWGQSRRFDADIQARYICFNITKINLNVDDLMYYAGVGELEVFGEKVSDASGNPPYITRVLSNYSEGVIQDPAAAAWTGFTTGDLDFEMTFRSDVPFFAIGFPAFWSSAGCPIRMDFDNGSTVYSVEYAFSGDGAKVIPLGQTLPAGKYTLTMTILSDEQFSDEEKIAMELDPSANAYRNYLVIGSASGSPLGTEYCLYERGANLAVDLYTKEQTGDGFVKLEHDLVKFTSASVTLTDGIAINFKAPEALLDAGAENISATFTFNGTQTVVTDYTVDNGKLVFSFRKIAPDMMGETIVATISADIGGETFTSTIRYSVLKYCQNLLNKYPGYVNKELRTLLVDLLNYGAASQAYTGRNADAPVTAGLDLYSAAYGTPVDPVLTDIEDSAYAVVDGAAATWKGVALALGDTVAVRFKFEAADIEGLKVKITSDEGNWTIDSSKFVAADAVDTYYVMFNGLNAAQMSLPIYATVYDANNNAISNTLQYSIESYAASMQGGSDTALAKLTMAMMKYGNSAKIYRDGLKTPKDYILANDIQGTWVREVEAALFKDLVASKLEGNKYAGVVDYLELDGVVLPVALDFNSDGTFAARLATDEAKTTVDNIVKAAARAYFIEVEHINELLVDMMLNSLLSVSGVRDMYMGNLAEGVYTVENDLVYISNTTEGLVAPENASEAVIHGDVMVITKLSDIAADAVTILGGYPILVFRQTGN